MSKSRDFENSKRDKMQDRKQARKHKMSVRDWESSPEDAQADKGFASGGRVRGMGAAKQGGKYSLS